MTNQRITAKMTALIYVYKRVFKFTKAPTMSKRCYQIFAQVAHRLMTLVN